MERTITYPTLNTDMILDLIWWAERGESDPRYHGWGRWYQNAWARVVNNTGKRLNWFNLGETEAERVAKANEENMCGTSFCMAGQAVVQSGYRLAMNRTIAGDSETNTIFGCIKSEWTGEVDDKGRRIYRDVGEERDISNAAQEILGLTAIERDKFFHGENSIDTLKGYANAFADARGLPLMFPDHGVLYAGDEFA